LSRQYLTASAPFAAAELQYNSVLRSLAPDNATAAMQFNAANGPYSDALKAFDSALPGLPWPTSALPAVQALITAHMALIGDLSVVVTTSNFSSWGLKMVRDRDAAAAAFKTLQTTPGLL
jgi:hypothetical protein